MLREIRTHELSALNNAIDVRAIDEPGPGGANHRYAIQLLPLKAANGTEPEDAEIPPSKILVIEFQNGPIKSAADMNGFTNEALLAILIDRMRGFQGMNRADGQTSTEINRMPAPFACRENALALTHLEDAMHWLQARTSERLQRGVEGTPSK